MKKRVVVIGGGTGTFTVLSGLKKHRNILDISAVVTSADSGGSAGRLRDEFGYLPVGDIRMALVALADEGLVDQDHLRKLFMYRFEKGGRDLIGHNFGNLLLVALTDILGSEIEAIRIASRMLGVVGAVHPVTTEKLTLEAQYDDGVVVLGETNIDEPKPGRDNHRIMHLTTTPKGTISPGAHEALTAADLIVLGPGDLYTSILAVCVVGGVEELLSRAKGKIVYISNLMSKYGQTSGMTLEDYVREISRYIERTPDVVLANNATLPKDLQARYAEEAEYPVVREGSITITERDLLSQQTVIRSKTDPLRRSLIRHDPDKLAAALLELL
jgi:uncharacterized cofD-like protein